ncbi:MAG: flagellar basal body-associated FliL family protein [Deltaproteobacteria bacterium]|nr:flagellar basal body-associated FliL family protein [Deltaproteobacteria bacterium]
MSKKIIIIAGSAFLVVFIGMILALTMIWSKLNTLDRTVNPPPVEEAEEAVEVVVQKIGPIYPLDTFIVNLADQGGNRYLRLSISLELRDEKVKNNVDERIPQIRDSILLILPNKTVDDLKSNEGKGALRNEISARLNAMFPAGEIANIYFTEFVMQ